MKRRPAPMTSVYQSQISTDGCFLFSVRSQPHLNSPGMYVDFKGEAERSAERAPPPRTRLITYNRASCAEEPRPAERSRSKPNTRKKMIWSETCTTSSVRPTFRFHRMLLFKTEIPLRLRNSSYLSPLSYSWPLRILQ